MVTTCKGVGGGSRTEDRTTILTSTLCAQYNKPLLVVSYFNVILFQLLLYSVHLCVCACIYNVTNALEIEIISFFTIYQ